MAPIYLSKMLCEHCPVRNLRSCHTGLKLKVPRTKTKTLGTRSFNYYAPYLWNELPEEIRREESLERFKRMVKTFLFKCAYDV